MSKEGSNSSGVASVVLGILGITSLLFTFFAFLAPLAGLILSVTALFFARSQRKVEKNNWSKWGMILSIIGILLNGIVVILLVSFVTNIARQYQTLCDSAGGCQNIPQYLQSQQAAGYAN